MCEPDLPPKNVIVVSDGPDVLKAANSLPGITWVCGAEPFVFARNVNLGIREADSDVIVCNDDATLKSWCGFSALSEAGREYGVTSAAIHGDVGNSNQRMRPCGNGVRFDPRMLCFICVFISKNTLDNVGLLDERFTAYGYDDDDYCRRVLDAGMTLAIYDGCVVEHGRLPSTFRHGKNIYEQLRAGRQIYEEKWREQAS